MEIDTHGLGFRGEGIVMEKAGWEGKVAKATDCGAVKSEIWLWVWAGWIDDGGFEGLEIKGVKSRVRYL